VLSSLWHNAVTVLNERATVEGVALKSLTVETVVQGVDCFAAFEVG
jgi:hypothetical protein